MDRAPAERIRAVVVSDDLQVLIDALADRGYQVLGPTVRDGAIVYDDDRAPDDLPAGWTDRQEAGRYRLERRDDDALFGFAVGPQSWKRFLHPPVMTLWTARKRRRRRDGRDRRERAAKIRLHRRARLRDHAIAIQDQVFCDGPYPDAAYAARRRDAFIVAVNCGQAGGTCFCVSMETGPKAEAGFDLALTELLDGRAARVSGRGRQRSRR